MVVPVVIAAVVVVVALVLGMQWWARSMNTRRLAEEDRLMASGVETTATVTRVPPGNRYIATKGMWVQVTLVFADLRGVEHSLKRNVLIHHQGDVQVGDTTRLWYDAQDPGRSSGPVVEREREGRRQR